MANEKQTETVAPPPAHVQAPMPPAPAAPALVAAKEMPKVERRPLNEGRFNGREFKQNAWVAIVEKGTTLEDVLKRDFWANVAAKLRVPDKIVVFAEDHSFYCELIVFMSANNWAQVQMLGSPIIISGRLALQVPELDYAIEYGGLHLKWIVKQKSDGRTIKGDGTLATEEQAQTWLRDFLKANNKKLVA